MSVSLYSGTLTKKLEVQPMEYIKSVVDREFSDSTILHINNGEQTIAPEDLKGVIGRKDWTVICDGDQRRFRDLENAVKHLSVRLTNVEKVSKVLSKYHVQNLVCQALLFLEGSQPEDNKKCYRFRGLKGEEKKRIKQFTDEIGMDFKKFISSADALIERRNMQIHASDAQNLNDRILEVQEWFEDFPEWKDKLSFEFKLMENWPIVDKYLPK